MNEHTNYRVLAPDSVAWYIQAALVADRTGNETARDMALARFALANFGTDVVTE